MSEQTPTSRSRLGRNVRLTIEHLEDRLTPAGIVALNDTYSATEDTTLNVSSALGVLTNDTDAGSSLQAAVFQGPAHGTLSLATDGSFTYTPNANYFGTDEFYYHAKDAVGGGYTLYTIDADLDQLVSINRLTGAVEVIGNIGYDFGNVDMAVLNGTIYAMTYNTTAGAFALVGIDPRTGAMISNVLLSNGSPSSIAGADGLAVLNGALVMSYLDGTPGVNVVGSINIQTGQVTAMQGYGGNLDFDGLGSTGTALYDVDTIAFSAPLKQILFQRIVFQPSPNVINVRDDVIANAIVSDLSFTPFGVYGIDSGNRQVLLYDSTTFDRLSIVPYGLVGVSYVGIDWAPDKHSIGKVTINVAGVPEAPAIPDTGVNEDAQSGDIVISRNALDGTEVTHFKITNIQHGTLFQHDGVTAITDGAFITFAQAQAGLRFTPTADYSGGASFDAQSAIGASNANLSPIKTAVIAVAPIADLPSVTNASTDEDVQTTSGLVVSRNAVDGAEVTHVRISNIHNGTLYLNDGVTAIASGAIITFAQASAGLKFTPAASLNDNIATFSFDIQGATSLAGAGLSPVATATISVASSTDIPNVTSASTDEDFQTTSGLVITRNAVDGPEVTHFRISNIQNGTLYKNDGITAIAAGSVITAAEAGAGLKFTPGADLNSSNATFAFDVQAATSAGGLGLSSAATATITRRSRQRCPDFQSGAEHHRAGR